MCESAFNTAGDQQGNGMGTAWYVWIGLMRHFQQNIKPWKLNMVCSSQKASKIFTVVKCWPYDCFSISNYSLVGGMRDLCFHCCVKWVFAVVWYDAVLIGIYLPTFRDSLTLTLSVSIPLCLTNTVQEEIILELLDLCSEMSVTTNKRCITSKKSEDF
jgi:hypothetical protein